MEKLQKNSEYGVSTFYLGVSKSPECMDAQLVTVITQNFDLCCL